MSENLKIGIVGLDTSHCVAFTRLLNDANHPEHLSGGVVTGAYAGGSEQFSLSRERVGKFTRTISVEMNVPLYENIPDLVSDVDALLLLSGDGRQHLAQFREMAAGKPVFIDKPLATSYEQALAIVALADLTHTPIMSSSSLRFADGIALSPVYRDGITTADAFGPAPIYDDYPGLFWYGIHTAEILFCYMGAGCRSVRCISLPGMDLILGEWQDGRVGMLRAFRNGIYTFGCLYHKCEEAVYNQAREQPSFYTCLLREVLPFLKTGKSPVDVRETLNIIAFVEAANLSKDNAGMPVSLDGKLSER